MITYLKDFPSSLFLPRYWTTLSSVWIYDSPPSRFKTPWGSTPGPKSCGTAKRWCRRAWKYLVLLAKARLLLRVIGWKGSSSSCNTSWKKVCTLARPASVSLNSFKLNPVKATYCLRCAAYLFVFPSWRLTLRHYHIFFF